MPPKKLRLKMPMVTENTALEMSPDTSQGLGGILSEALVGALMHDVGPFSSKIERGIDGNLEFLFITPSAFDVI
jgi:hypothetical protein